MPVTIHLIRHGEGSHNVSDDNKDIQDPRLTDKGEEQCCKVRDSFPYADNLVRLMASPLTRTIQTCALTFRTPKFVDSHPSAAIRLLPEFQEVSTLPYDTGVPPQALQEKFGEMIDTTHLDGRWNEKNTSVPWSDQVGNLLERGQEARKALLESVKDLPDDAHVGVASHGTFLHFATNDFSGLEPGMTTAWDNTEWRSYHLLQSSENRAGPILHETQESWARRHGSEERPSEMEQMKRRQYLLRKLEEDYRN